MGVVADLIAALQSYADTGGDINFRIAWGEPGHRVSAWEETHDTGQAWANIVNFATGLFTAVASVLGGWMGQDFDVTVGQTSITLTYTPMSADGLLVFRDGLLMRKVASLGAGPLEYTWATGSKTIHFNQGVAAEWFCARYLRSVT
jgi:hypothetical protein